MPQPRLLTFNFHEPYLCLLAKTGLDFDVGQYESGPLAREWHEHYRPRPKNLHLIEHSQWREALDKGKYQVVLAQNEMNAVDVAKAPCARLLLCHNRKSFLATSATVDEGEPLAGFHKLLSVLEELFHFIFISESKRDDYGIPGAVIPPGIDVEEWGGLHGGGSPDPAGRKHVA